MTSGLIAELNPASLPSVIVPPSGPGPGPPAGTSPTSQPPRTTTSAIREDRRASIVAYAYARLETIPRAAQRQEVSASCRAAVASPDPGQRSGDQGAWTPDGPPDERCTARSSPSPHRLPRRAAGHRGV